MLLGILYDVKKQYDLSETQYRLALSVKPGFGPAANNLAYLLAIQDKRIDEALDLAKQAKDTLPADPRVMDTLGWIYYKKGLYDNAINEFSQSLEKIPHNAVVHFHLGLAFHKKGQNKSARRELEKALHLDGNFDGSIEAMRVLAGL